MHYAITDSNHVTFDKHLRVKSKRTAHTCDVSGVVLNVSNHAIFQFTQRLFSRNEQRVIGNLSHSSFSNP